MTETGIYLFYFIYFFYQYQRARNRTALKAGYKKQNKKSLIASCVRGPSSPLKQETSVQPGLHCYFSNAEARQRFFFLRGAERVGLSSRISRTVTASFKPGCTLNSICFDLKNRRLLTDFFESQLEGARKDASLILNSGLCCQLNWIKPSRTIINEQPDL